MKEFIVIFFLILTAELLAQDGSAKRYSGHFENTPLKEILNNVEQQSFITNSGKRTAEECQLIAPWT